MDPDQRATTGAVLSGSTLFVKKLLKILKSDKKKKITQMAAKSR